MKEDKGISIEKTLKERAVLKQQIFEVTNQLFCEFKILMEQEVENLKSKIDHEKVRLIYQDSGTYEARLTLGGDVIVFHMHTNIFKFDDQHALWKSSYVKNHPNRAYCGVINIYNFLSDSFQFNRMNDHGYLIGRLFINMEKHYLVEGKGQLGYLYRDFINKEFNQDEMKKLLRTTMAHAIDFELLVPPYDNVQVVSVAHMMQLSDNLQLQTGKRLGFKFQYDRNDNE